MNKLSLALDINSHSGVKSVQLLREGVPLLLELAHFFLVPFVSLLRIIADTSSHVTIFVDNRTVQSNNLEDT